MNNPEQSSQLKPLNLISSAKSLLLGKVIYSQVPGIGIRAWTALGGVFLAATGSVWLKSTLLSGHLTSLGLGFLVSIIRSINLTSKTLLILYKYIYLDF